MSTRGDDLDGLTTGQRIQILRERKSLTRPVLAGLVGRSAEWLKAVERGTLLPPRLPMLVQIGTVLGLPDVADLAGTDMSIGDASVPIPGTGPLPGEDAGRRQAPARSFSDVLDRLIRESGTEAQEIARQVPCNPGHVSRLRQGKKRPSLQVAARLDDLLGAGGELVAAAVRDGLPAELAGLAEAPARTAPEVPAQTEQLIEALRELTAEVARLAAALGAAGYRVPGASARRAGLYLVRPPDEAG